MRNPNTKRCTYGIALPIALSLCLLAGTRAQESSVDVDQNGSGHAALMHHQSLAFVENQGQWDPRVEFVVRKGAMLAGFSLDAVRVNLAESEKSGVLVEMRFRGALASATLAGESRQPTTRSYFLGNDSDRWRTDVPSYDSILYRGLYEGVDLRVREHKGQLEYDVLLAPGADLSAVVVECSGVEKLDLEPDGSLLMDTAAGPLVQTPPITWQVTPEGARDRIECTYRVLGNNCYGFAAEDHDSSFPLVIDPGLEWSTFLGGNNVDQGFGVHVGQSGLVTVVGSTASTNFPTTDGAYDRSHNGGQDLYISQFDPTETGVKQLLWSTYVGGSELEQPYGVFVDDSGIVTVAGTTFSPNFPTAGSPYSNSLNGLQDIFALRLGAAGSQLLWSTYLGGSNHDGGGFRQMIAVSDTGLVTLAGSTVSDDFPTTIGAYDNTHNGEADAVLTTFDPGQKFNAQLIYSTYLGGSDRELAHAMAVSPTDPNVFTVVGETRSADFPMVNPFDSSLGGRDGFVARIDTNTGALSPLLYGTYLGHDLDDRISTVDVQANGHITVGGTTLSPSFPTTPGAFDETHNRREDVFVTRLDPEAIDAKQQLTYSTFLGGSKTDGTLADDFDPPSLEVDERGDITICGWTNSDDFPITRCTWDSTKHPGFVSRISPRGQGAKDLIYSTFLGGTPRTWLWHLTLDWRGFPVITGLTDAFGYPTTPGAFQRNKKAGWDAFVTTLQLPGSHNYGDGWPGTNGVPGLVVTDYTMLNEPLTLDIDNSSGAQTTGFLFIGTSEATLPTTFGGTLNLLPTLILPLAQIPDTGLSLTCLIPNSNSLCLISLYLQAVMADPGASHGMSFTPGLRLVVGGR